MNGERTEDRFPESIPLSPEMEAFADELEQMLEPRPVDVDFVRRELEQVETDFDFGEWFREALKKVYPQNA